MRRLDALGCVVGVVVLLSASVASAGNCVPGLAPAGDEWNFGLPATASVQWTTSDRGLRSDGQAKTYVAQGSKLIAIREEGVNAGQQAWLLDFGTSISTAPLVYPSSVDATMRIVIGVSGRVYIVSADAGGILYTIDTRRNATTYAADDVGYVPTVQLAAYSTGLPMGTPDRLFLTTRRTGSNADIVNQVQVYDANMNQGLLWSTDVFNTVDGGRGCAVDYDSNHVYCAFTQSLTNAHSLFKIPTNPGGSGQFAWRINAGSLVSPPQLRGSHLFAVTTEGSLRVFNPVTGAPITGTSLATTSTVVRPFFTEPRPYNNFRYLTMMVTQDGLLHAIAFNPTTQTLQQLYHVRGGTFNEAVVDMPMLDTEVGRMYVPGTTRIHRGQIQTGDFTNCGQTYGFGTPVTPGLGVGDGGTTADHLTLASTQRVRHVCSYSFQGPVEGRLGCTAATRVGSARVGDDEGSDPGAEGSAGAAPGPGAGDPQLTCPPPSDACQESVDIEGFCVNRPLPDGTTGCTPACGSSGICKGGRCVPQNEATPTVCACTNIGDFGCGYGSGKTCCGAGACKDLETDVDNCGACGFKCPETAGGMYGSIRFACVQGICKQPVCTSIRPPSDLNDPTFRSTNLKGGPPINLTLTRTYTGTCNVVVSLAGDNVDALWDFARFIIIPPSGVFHSQLSQYPEPPDGSCPGYPSSRGGRPMAQVIGGDDNGLSWFISSTPKDCTGATGGFESHTTSNNAHEIVDDFSPGNPVEFFTDPPWWHNGQYMATGFRQSASWLWTYQTGPAMTGGKYHGIYSREWRYWGTTGFDYIYHPEPPGTEVFVAETTERISALAFNRLPRADGSGVAGVRNQLYALVDQAAGGTTVGGYNFCNAQISSDCSGRPASIPIEIPNMLSNYGKFGWGGCNGAGDCYFPVDGYFNDGAGPLHVVRFVVIRGSDGMALNLKDYQTAYGIAPIADFPPGTRIVSAVYGEDLYWIKHNDGSFGATKVPR